MITYHALSFLFEEVFSSNFLPNAIPEDKLIPSFCQEKRPAMVSDSVRFRENFIGNPSNLQPSPVLILVITSGMLLVFCISLTT